MFGSLFPVRLSLFFGGKYAETYREDQHKKVLLGLLIHYAIRARDAGDEDLAAEIQECIDELRKILLDEYGFTEAELKKKDPEELWTHYLTQVSTTWPFLTDLRTRVKEAHDAARARERKTA